MKQKRARQPESSTVAKPRRSGVARQLQWLWALLLAGALGVPLLLQFRAQSRGSNPQTASPETRLTFHKDIAPIVFTRCAYCHRPGQAAPFTLLSYADVKKRAKEIADVTARRYMPPWLPEPGYGEFANDRRLTADEFAKLQRWIGEGLLEGDAADSPRPPNWTEGWQLGEPDLVVQVPQPYALGAEGKDVYRNLVVPIPLAARRFVRAVDFRPGNPKVIHHAFINIDQTRESRRLAEKQNPAGFDGMQLPETAVMVAGQMLGWQPGKRAEPTGEGLSWPLEKNSDLVLQLHLHPSGKPEQVQPAVGFYFTEAAPTNTPFRLYLPQWRIDIPAGAKNYAVENSYVLPIDVDVLRVSPHAHYLAKEMQGYAILPDGTKRWLLLIKNWDFNWQGDYRYATPVFLPKGSKVVMRFSYDNSAENPHNPNHPPKRVRYGLAATDEMAELTYQVVPRKPQELSLLRADYLKKATLDVIAFNENVLKDHPEDEQAHAKLGEALLQFARFAEARDHLQRAVQLNPSNHQAHYDLGALYLAEKQLGDAQVEFETVVRLNPDDYQAHGSLGSVYYRKREFDRAESEFAIAVQLNPDDAIARRNLELVRGVKRQLPGSR